METGTRVSKPVDYSDYYAGDEIDQAFIECGIDPTILAQDDENMNYLNLNSGNFLLKQCYFDVDGEKYHVTAEPTGVGGDYYIADFLNDLSERQFKELWRDEASRKAIAALMRHPGHMHEWLMIAALPTLKDMGIDFNLVKDVRTKITTDFEFFSEGKKCTHGNNRGSILMHRDLKKAIKNCAEEYSEKLQRFKNSEEEEDEGLIPPDPYEYLKEALNTIVDNYSIDLNSAPMTALKNFLT